MKIVLKASATRSIGRFPSWKQKFLFANIAKVLMSRKIDELKKKQIIARNLTSGKKNKNIQIKEKHKTEVERIKQIRSKTLRTNINNSDFFRKMKRKKNLDYY